MDKEPMKSREEQINTFVDACRKVGLRVTQQRLEIQGELMKATDHPTAETLYQRLRLKLPTISLDTVYRNLAVLANHGLINKVETSASLARFEASQIPHHHLICRTCGEIMDFRWSFIDEAALPDEIRNWGEIDHRNVVAYGICNKCLK
jgi:Fur family peroxide stress response transcriptional regulator